MDPTSIDKAWQGLAPCKACGIRALALFADLAEADFALIHRPIDEWRRPAGATLYNAGDPGEAVFTVRDGLVKLVRLRADGTQRIVRLVGPGGTLGLEATLGEAYAHAAVVVQPVLLCRIPVAVIERLGERTPRLHRQLMTRWRDAVERADSWLTDLATGSARQRLARLLLEVMDDDGAAVLLSRPDLAAILGITTEHASRTVSGLKRDGLIRPLGGGRFACDRAGLAAQADAE